VQGGNHPNPDKRSNLLIAGDEDLGDFDGFDSSGILQRNGNRTVLNQGPHPTCGPTSCGMILDDLLPNRTKTSLGGYSGVTSKGITADKLAKLLKSNGVNAKFKKGMSVEDLADATSKGKPAIAAIRVGNGGHAIVDDGITIKFGEKVVAIRNPWGKQYFQKVSEFKKVFLRQGVIIE
jgi:filamentous hemagglutinin